MFNLEQALADWRQKMLAAGIENPVPFEELELHLREEMERQISKGVEAQEAFDKAVQCLGDGRLLKAEFQQAGTLPTPNPNRIYDLMLALYALFTAYITLGMIISSIHHTPSYAGGSVAAFWMGLFGKGLIRSQEYLPAAASIPAGVIILNIFCFVAIVMTLWARHRQRKSAARLTQLLNCALLLALPFGTLIGLYGGWTGLLGRGNTRFREAVAVKIYLTTGLSSNIILKILTGALLIICSLFVGLMGSVVLLHGFINVMEVVSAPAYPSEIQFNIHYINSFILISIVLSFLIGSWMLWVAAQILQNLWAPRKPNPAHV